MATATSSTVEDVMALPEGSGRCDLIAGEVHEMAPAGGEHSLIAGTFAWVIGAFASERGLGSILVAEPGFILRRDPDTMLSPDVAYVATDRMPPADQRVGPWPMAPDLAVEVISPSERSRLVAAKVTAYLDGGCRLVWIVEPRRRTVTVWTPDRISGVYREGDVLDGGEVLPGFTMTVAVVFATMA